MTTLAQHNLGTFTSTKVPHCDLVIPDTWKDIAEFSTWWTENDMPVMFPPFAEVFTSDDATAVCVFRKGRFQVELYLIHPKPVVPSHEHPNVEVIKIRSALRVPPSASSILRNGEAHGSGMKLEAETAGFPLFAVQHWLTREPTTIASMWKGKTAGPKHESIIRRFNPDAYIKDGYADITRKQESI